MRWSGIAGIGRRGIRMGLNKNRKKVAPDGTTFFVSMYNYSN